jgi:hypothetical protein
MCLTEVASYPHLPSISWRRASQNLPLANQTRLFPHTAAYGLMRTIRDAIPVMQALAIGEFSTIRLPLLKIRRPWQN